MSPHRLVLTPLHWESEAKTRTTGRCTLAADHVICARWPILDLDHTDLEPAVVEAALAAWRNTSTDPSHAPLTWAALTTLSGPTPPT